MLKRILPAALLLSVFALSEVSVPAAADGLPLGVTASGVQPQVTVNPPPGWVAPVTFKRAVPSDPDGIRNGEYFLLYDEQTNAVGEYANYQHLVIELRNEKSVEQNSRISVEFDPSYQSLQLHQVTLWRDNAPLEQEIAGKLELLRREKDLENLLYDGQVTATLLLEDVRKGDILEYSYTLVGQNPAFEGEVSDMVYLGWSVPVHERHYRLLWPRNKPLSITPIGRQTHAIRKVEHNSHDEYRVALTDYPTMSVDSEVPAWFDPWDRVMFSSVNNWRQVVAWSLAHYQLGDEVVAEVHDLVGRIRAQYDAPVDQAAAALRFVQDEVRYVGIEMGKGGYIPSRPAETVARRYGDCKDKTYLLLALLKGLGIEGYPVLANTGTGERLGDGGPGFNIFDHVFVKAVINGKDYWLETTTNNQLGTLDTIYQPYYGQVLVVKQGVDSLVRMPDPLNIHKTVYDEQYDLSAGVGEPGTVAITTTFTGNDAERFRRRLNDSGKATIVKDYLDYYHALYGEVIPDGEVEIKDNHDDNVIVVTEKYKVPGIWQDDTGKQRHYVHFYNNDIATYLESPDVVNRVSPYSYSYPVNIEQNATVLLPESWNLENEVVDINNPFFHFYQELDYEQEKGIYHVTTRIKTHKRYIETGEVAAFVAAVDEATTRLNQGIFSSYGGSVSPVSTASDPGLTTQQAVLLIYSAIIILYLYALAEFWFTRKKSPQPEGTRYYPVDAAKVFVLAITTFGIYLIYWFYKNWHYVKERESSAIIPWGRALFYSLWLYPFYNSFKRDDAFAGTGFGFWRNTGYALLSLLFLVAVIISGNEHVVSYAAMIVVAACVMPFAANINSLVDKDNHYYRFHSRWRPRHIVVIALFLAFTTYDVASRISFIPSSNVEPGSVLWDKDIKLLHRLKVMSPNDKLILYYSDAYFSFSEDGNGLTDKGVFSYWRDEDTGEIYTEVAKYGDIAEIKHYPSKVGANVIQVIRKDGSEFTVYSIDSKKHSFYTMLKSQWEMHKTPGDELPQVTVD